MRRKILSSFCFNYRFNVEKETKQTKKKENWHRLIMRMERIPKWILRLNESAPHKSQRLWDRCFGFYCNEIILCAIQKRASLEHLQFSIEWTYSLTASISRSLFGSVFFSSSVCYCNAIWISLIFFCNYFVFFFYPFEMHMLCEFQARGYPRGGNGA